MKTTIKVKECECKGELPTVDAKGDVIYCEKCDSHGYLQQDGSPLPRIGDYYCSCLKSYKERLNTRESEIVLLCDCEGMLKLKSIEINDKVAVLTWQ